MLLLLLSCLVLTESVQANFKGPPEDVTLSWQDPIMIIQTSDQYDGTINSNCIKLVLQLKNREELEWQRTITSSDCHDMDSSTTHIHCSFNNPNLDPEKCFYMQLQFQTVEGCKWSIYESEWSNNIFMKNYSLVESCDVPPAAGVQTFIITFSVISTVIIIIVVFLRCNMERMKKCIFPIVPDPKNSFHDLFDSHNGYLQEWVKTEANDTHHEEVECVMDEKNDEPVLTYVKANEIVMPVNQSDIEKQEDKASNVCFGNINFTMNESMYVML
ncbi:cytokine receptor-like factor 2 [Bufo bufo]|uniref:cytokine receptor-like factor 2 n=1 Tax=Bufo bufo TaxID=8384 RepID=UPI001ABE1C82|nr:cytokine receptor-like factor 2 [Bufo bufo]